MRASSLSSATVSMSRSRAASVRARSVARSMSRSTVGSMSGSIFFSDLGSRSSMPRMAERSRRACSIPAACEPNSAGVPGAGRESRFILASIASGAGGR